MVKFYPCRRSQYLCVVLCLCLACMALHFIVDSTGGFTQTRLSFQGNPLAEEAFHAHEDDFLPPALTLDSGAVLVVAGLANPDWKAPSQTSAPLLPPPKSI